MSTQTLDALTVADAMLPLDKVPAVPTTMLLKQGLEEMGRRRLGIICITDKNGVLQGILTDGDVRRKLLEVQKPFSALFSDDVIVHAVTAPVTVSPDMALTDAVAQMEQKEVWDLPVVNTDGTLAGLLHLHPVVKLVMQTNG